MARSVWAGHGSVSDNNMFKLIKVTRTAHGNRSNERTKPDPRTKNTELFCHLNAKVLRFNGRVSFVLTVVHREFLLPKNLYPN